MKTIILSFLLILALGSFVFCDMFKPRVDYYVGRDCFDLAVGDLNNDGKNDVAVGNDSYNWIRVYYQGLNSLETYIDYINDYMVLPYCPLIGDINNDGLNDLVVIGAGQIFIWIQNEFNTLEYNQKIDMGASNVRAGALSDLDSDGDLDIIASLYSTNEVGIFWQTSLLVFTKETLSADNGPFGIGVLDVNLDGNKDIVVANYLGPTLNVFQQDPDHSFFKSTINFNLEPSHHFIQIAVGDLSGDEKDDLVVAATSGQGQVYSYISSKSGLVPSAIYDAYAAWAVDIGDVNNDGKNDIVIGGGSDIYVYFKDNGNLTLPGLGNIRDIAIDDVTGDGLNDILSTSDYTNKSVSIFEQDNSSTIPDVTITITNIPDKVLKKHKYTVEWKLDGDFKEVEQTEILWGLVSGEYTHSGKSFSGEGREFRDTLQAPKMEEKSSFYIYLVAHLLIEGGDFYSEEKKIKVLHDNRKKKRPDSRIN